MKGKRGPAALSKKSLPQLRRTLDEVFKRYIRNRDVDSHTGWGNCITCGKPLRIGTKDAQAGHYIPVGRACDSALAFEETNCNLQCSHCNLQEGGRFVAHATAIVGKFGLDVLDELNRRSEDRCVHYLDRDWYIQRIEYYRGALKEMDAA